MTRIASLFLVIVMSSPAWAVTKYVTQSGTCTSGATTYNPTTDTCGSGSATVYLDPRVGADLLGASNTLQIRSGTYTISCINALIEGGTSTTSTRIEPYSGAAVVINKGTSDARDCLISFAGSQPYITIDGHNSDGTGSMIFDGKNSGIAADQGILVGNSAANITIANLEIRNAYESCMVGFSGTGFVVTGNYIHNCGTANSYLWHAIYYAGSGSIISHNTFRNIAGYAVHCYSGSMLCNNGTIENNLMYDVGTASDSQSGGVLLRGDGNTVRYNMIRCVLSTSDFGIHAYNTGTNNTIEQNSITNCGTGVLVTAGVSGTKVRNNIAYGNSTNILNAGTGTILTTNFTTDPSWTNAASDDLTLMAGSAAINACTDIGLSFNGAAPDCGAAETYTGTGGLVSGNTLDAQLGMDFRTPLIPGTTGWTVNNGRTVTNVTLVGSSIARLTFDGAACTNVQSWTWSYSGGTATDSAAVGSLLFGQLNQPLLTVGATAATNTCGGSTYGFRQDAFQYHGVFSDSESTPSILSAENVATFPVEQSGAVRIPMAIVCDAGADCPSTAFSLWVSQGGGYIPLPNTPGAGQVSFCGTTYRGPNTLPNPTPTSNKLSTPGTFVPGAVTFTFDATPNVILAASNKTVMEPCVKFTASASGTYTFRYYLQDGTPLGAYSHTPTVNIVPMQASGGP